METKESIYIRSTVYLYSYKYNTLSVYSDFHSDLKVRCKHKVFMPQTLPVRKETVLLLHFTNGWIETQRTYVTFPRSRNC